MQFDGVKNRAFSSSQQSLENARPLEFHVLFVGGVLVCGLSVNLQFCKEWQLITQAVFPTPSLPLSTVHSVGQVPFALSCVGAHGWGAKICQLWEKSPSRNWLPMVEAPGCLRHPNSTLRCSCW